MGRTAPKLSPVREVGAAEAFDLAQALADARACGWRWLRGEARLALAGDANALALDGADPDHALDALLASLSAASLRTLDAAFGRPAPGGPLEFELDHADGRRTRWRGAWSADGRSAQGLVGPLATFGTAAAADRDPLTGLLARAAFLARADAELAKGGGLRVAVADWSRFHRLNSALGLQLADLALAAVAARLSAAFPADACAARVGEDEFAVLAPAGDADLATAMRAALEAPLRIGGCDVHPRFTISVAQVAAGEPADGAELLRRAGAELRPEPSGQGEAAAAPALSRLTLENDLRGALGRGELEPWFQPIVRLADGRLAGFEALARWRHPRLGLIPPDDFLPLMSEVRLMAALGRRMTRACAERLAAWRAAFPGAADLFVTVNLTMGELDRPGLVDDVAEVIADTGLPPRTLKLELTEGEVMRDPDAAIVTLEALRRVGAGLAIDDFGMGFSSLSYLTRLPVDTLKVDRYFVRTMAVSENSEKVMRSIVALGRDLGLQIVGEGVEDADSARRLRDIGCTFGQGFGYARPLGKDEAEDYLRESLAGTAPIRGGG